MTADLDLTTLSDTYIHGLITNIQQHLDDLTDQEQALQDQRNTLYREQGVLTNELERRASARPYTDAERDFINPNGDTHA